MFKFSKFAVCAAALMTQAHAAEEKKDEDKNKKAEGKSATPIDGAVKIYTPFTDAKDIAQWTARLAAFSYDFAGNGVLRAEHFTLSPVTSPNRYAQFFGLFKLIEDLKKYTDDDKDEYPLNKAIGGRDSLVTEIKDFHGKTAQEKKDKESQIPSALAFDASAAAKFLADLAPSDKAIAESFKSLFESVSMCLRGDCNEDTMKEVLNAKKTIEDLKIEGVTTLTSEADCKKFLEAVQKHVKTIEELANKIKAGTKTAMLQAQLKKKEDECKALALGLGLGLGLGLPVVFAVSLLVLFKSGRLAWVPSSTVDSQA